MHFAEARADIYPYLLVNIGSGVSMIKVSGPTQYQRIGGTSLGGGTLWGLLSLLTGSRTFDEMLSLAERGDNAAVDMLVGDIYGTDYSKIGLKSSTIASSFGKVFKMKREAEREAEDGGGSAYREDGILNGDGRKSYRKFGPEDVSRSLLYAIRFVPSPSSHTPHSKQPAPTVTTSAKSPTFNPKNTTFPTSTLADPSSVVTGKP
jgi:type II pantothenate kinase